MAENPLIFEQLRVGVGETEAVIVKPSLKATKIRGMNPFKKGKKTSYRGDGPKVIYRKDIEGRFQKGGEEKFEDAKGPEDPGKMYSVSIEE